MEISTEMVEFAAADGKMQALLARPSGSGKHPAVIVVMEAFGLNEHIKNVAKRIAAEGYVALAPDFYYREKNAVVGYDQLPEAIRLMQTLNDDKTSFRIVFSVKQVRWAIVTVLFVKISA